MKILFLTPKHSSGLGGVERHVRLLTEELEKRGHEVKELALDSIKDTPRHAPRSILFKFSAWGYLWRNRELLKWADVIHVHDVFWWILPFILMESFKDSPFHSERRNLKRKAFITFHGWEGIYPPTISAVIQKRLASWLCAGTVGVGNFYQKWYGVKPDKVVWGGLSNKFICSLSSLRSRSGRHLETSSRSHPALVFLGRLEEVNGIEVVIKAIEKVSGDRIGRHLETSSRSHPVLFVGDGNYRKQAEKVGEVTGMVENPWRYLTDADVVIASSYLSILEAAAMGKRIIAIANNPLKLDYLNCHPLRKYFQVVRNVEELTSEILKRSHPGFRQGDSSKQAKDWSRKQTPQKLADVYEELWNKRLV